MNWKMAKRAELRCFFSIICTKRLCIKDLNKKSFYAHKYSSKTVKNEWGCQIFAKNGYFSLQNEGNLKKFFKFLKKYSKRGWQTKTIVV